MRTLAFIFAVVVAAQQLPSFEVASVKPNVSGSNSSSFDGSGGRLTFTNVSLRDCISYAFDIPTGRDPELETPDWMRDAKFDIAATFPPATPRDRVPSMLRALLNERFGLQTHTETRKVTAYALTVMKGGPKLTRNTVREDGSFAYGPGRIRADAIGMTGFANRLSGREFDLGRIVIDRTGLEGAFDFDLVWTPVGTSPDAATEASLFTSIREQLGLELKTEEIEIHVVVVDRAERIPSSN